jgi:hypothetical protein
MISQEIIKELYEEQRLQIEIEFAWNLWVQTPSPLPNFSEISSVVSEMKQADGWLCEEYIT